MGAGRACSPPPSQPMPSLKPGRVALPFSAAIFTFFSAMTALAAAWTRATWRSSSRLNPTSGIITSGFTLMPAFCTSAAASKTARASDWRWIEV